MYPTCVQLSSINISRFIPVVAVKHTPPLLNVRPQGTKLLYIDCSIIVFVKQSCVQTNNNNSK